MKNSNALKSKRRLWLKLPYSCFAGFVCFVFFISFSSCKKNEVTNSNAKFALAHSSANLSGFKVVRLSGGGYVVAAHDLQHNYTCHLTGISEDGNKLWEQQINDSVRITDIAASNDNAVIICGYYKNQSLTGENMYLERTNYAGKTDWLNLIPGDPIYYLCMAVGPDNTIYLDMVNGLAGNSTNNFLIKCNPSGQLVTNTMATNMTPDSLLCLPLAMEWSGSSLFVTGAATTWNDPGHTTINLVYNMGDFCFRMDTAANVNWMVYQFDSCAISQVLTHTISGNTIAVAGSGSDTVAFTQYSFPNNYTADRGNSFWDDYQDIVVKVYDPLTGTVKSNKIALPDIAQYPCIAATADNGYIVSACDNLTGFDYKIIIAKTDNNLNTLWTRQVNLPYTASPFGIFQAADGGYIVFASVQSFNNYKDIAFIKTDANGNLVNK